MSKIFHIYENIEGWFDYQSIYSDAVKNAKDGAHFVEVGSWKGKSSSYMAVEIANTGKQIKFDCIDTWLGSKEHTADQHVIAGQLYETFLTNTEIVKNLD